MVLPDSFKSPQAVVNIAHSLMAEGKAAMSIMHGSPMTWTAQITARSHPCVPYTTQPPQAVPDPMNNGRVL